MELYEGIDADKTVFAGLDKAGKSSIILGLQKELSQIASIKPTRMADRKIFDFVGKKIAAWDLGGQESYREKYLENPQNYFDQTRYFIHVIDIQDAERFDESLQYLQKIHVILKDFELNPVVSVFLHKSDPDYTEQINNNEQKSVYKLRNDIERVIGDSSSVKFYRTSIYKLFSITSAFTRVVKNTR